MTQTKRMSLLESLTNIAIGYCIMLCGQLVIFPVVGLDVTWGQNLQIGGLFTVLSVGRIYVIRRWFNRI